MKILLSKIAYKIKEDWWFYALMCILFGTVIGAILFGVSNDSLGYVVGGIVTLIGVLSTERLLDERFKKEREFDYKKSLRERSLKSYERLVPLLRKIDKAIPNVLNDLNGPQNYYSDNSLRDFKNEIQNYYEEIEDCLAEFVTIDFNNTARLGISLDLYKKSVRDLLENIFNLVWYHKRLERDSEKLDAMQHINLQEKVVLNLESVLNSYQNLIKEFVSYFNSF